MPFVGNRSSALVALIFVLGLALRLPALWSAFWFDEVWSWQLAHSVRYPWEILTQVRHDNNHPLNSLILYLEPPGLPWAWYRLHSLVAGALTVPLAMLVTWHRGRLTAGLAGLLFAVNFWLVMVSTEARGYALAIFFALIAYHALRQYLADRGGKFENLPAISPGKFSNLPPQRWLYLFWLAVVLGFLSHLTFLHVEAGFIFWSLRHYSQRSKRPGDELVPMLRCHLVPGVFVVVYGLVNVVGMETGGGDPDSVFAVLGRLFAFGLGVPLPLLAILIAVAVLVRGLVLQDAEQRIFFLTTILASPAVILLTRPAYLFERYFFLSFAFFLLLLADTSADLLRQPGWRRLVGGVVLAMVCLGSLRASIDFVRAGRGEPLAALQYIADHGGGTVTGDTDFRVEKMVTFYSPYLSGPTTTPYVMSKEGADWLLVHWRDEEFPPDHVEVAGHRYRRVPEAVYPPRGFGYWGWFVYRREENAILFAFGGTAELQCCWPSPSPLPLPVLRC